MKAPTPYPQCRELALPSRVIQYPRRPLIMGIVNVNDDSFSGDGSLYLPSIIHQTRRQIQEGADIIDVGAESARTNRRAIEIGEEIRRFKFFFNAWPEILAPLKPRDEQQVWPPILSANTWRSEVACQTLGMGAEILNDMGGLHQPTNAELCAQHGAALLIMHNPGRVKVAATTVTYSDIVASMIEFFEPKISIATDVGLSCNQLILDPGIDFAKQRDANLLLLKNFCQLTTRFPLTWLLPISRKTVIGEALGIDQPAQRDAGTIALLVQGLLSRAKIFRVHNVEAAWLSLKLLSAIHRQSSGGSAH